MRAACRNLEPDEAFRGQTENHAIRTGARLQDASIAEKEQAFVRISNLRLKVQTYHAKYAPL